MTTAASAASPPTRSTSGQTDRRSATGLRGLSRIAGVRTIAVASRSGPPPGSARQRSSSSTKASIVGKR